MAGLDLAIHVFGSSRVGVDARVKPAHDGDYQLPLRTSTINEVVKLKYLGGHRLHATFSDGTVGEYDFSGLVKQAGPVGQPLRDPSYFGRMFVKGGAPTWPNGFDMCPDWLRREIEKAGA